MKKIALLFLILFALPLYAQDYEVPQITVSRDKVRVSGKAYYAHVVTAKQTLYSISVAYGVVLQDIYDSNKNLNLETEGLKIGQVLLIPTEPLKRETEEPKVEAEVEANIEQEEQKPFSAPVLFPQMHKKISNYTEEEESEVLEVINIAVLLPFGADSLVEGEEKRAADTKSIDFYSGALLAAHDLGNKGIKLNITSYDISQGNISEAMLSNADIVLGPISGADVQVAAQNSPYGKFVISPLDPKNTYMTDTLRVIQVPTATTAQAEDAVRWAIADMTPADSLVLIRESGKALIGAPAVMLSALEEAGIKYSVLSYDLISGLQIQPEFVNRSSTLGVTRYLIASEDESFVNDAVRNINLMAYKKQAVVLYGPSKVRSFATIETENLHNISTHISSTYQIDYSKPEVLAFVKAYRALFACEPNSFAFHGYDCLNYFASACARFGKNWVERLPGYKGKGLQTDFSFSSQQQTGLQNNALRRVVYTTDYQILAQ